MSRSFTALIVFAVAAVYSGSLLAEPCIPVISEEFEAKVVGISDGDTIRVLRDEKAQVVIRLEGIDAPERKQAFGAVAEKRLGQLTAGKMATIRKTGQDRYGRTLAYVVIDGRDVNATMVEEGLAWHYRAYNCEERLKKLEAEAKAAKRGLWAKGDATPPWDFRKPPAPSPNFEPPPHTKNSPKAKPTFPPTSTPTPATPNSRYWLNTRSGARHNSRCKHYGSTTSGRACGPNEGKACGICGG